jgi:hypothetical protein
MILHSIVFNVNKNFAVLEFSHSLSLRLSDSLDVLLAKRKEQRAWGREPVLSEAEGSIIARLASESF